MKNNMLSATITILCILCLWQCNAQNTVPDELAGIWKTKIPDYEGSFFGLQEDTITFGTVEGDVQVFTITKIKINRENGEWISFIIHYLDNNFQPCELPIYFHPINDGIMRFKNKEDVTWFREKT
ncbi:MAG: hypothetical protein WBF32_05010 [Candidatus Aminicenantaceae bacterium]